MVFTPFFCKDDNNYVGGFFEVENLCCQALSLEELQSELIKQLKQRLKRDVEMSEIQQIVNFENATVLQKVRIIWEKYKCKKDFTWNTIHSIIQEWAELFEAELDRLDREPGNNPDRNESDGLSDGLSIAIRLLNNLGMLGGTSLARASEQLLLTAWQRTGEAQKDKSKKIYRAAIAYYLAETNLTLGDKGAAFWWQLHALADDYLEGSDGGAAKLSLKHVFGIASDEFYETLKKLANFSDQNKFAEGVVAKFAMDNPQYATYFASPTSTTEFSVSKGYLGALIHQLKQNEKSDGKLLEKIGCYLFMHIPGCTPAPNLVTDDRATQQDVVIRNLAPNTNLSSETFGRYFAIEAKDTQTPVGSAACGYFLLRLKLMHMKFGIILSRIGISGQDQDDKAARSIIRRGFHEDGILCIVLTLKDLEHLADGKNTLRNMLFERVEEFRFGSRSNKSSE